MGRAIDLFVTYRFIKLLVTPFQKQEAFKLGIIDEKGKRITEPGTNKPTTLRTVAEKNAYTVLHKLVFNIKKIFEKVPGLRTKLGTYAAALFLLKDTFKEDVDPKMWEKEFMKYLKENNYELDNSISEEIKLDDGSVYPLFTIKSRSRGIGASPTFEMAQTNFMSNALKFGTDVDGWPEPQKTNFLRKQEEE